MWPLCCVPKMLPAPRISRSRMAMAKPAPMSLNSSIARSRLAEVLERYLFGSTSKIAIGAMLVTADAAAKLVQIGQAVAIGFVDENRVGVGNIEPAFDDRRGQQNVELVIHEIEHHLFQLDAPAFGRGRCECVRRARCAAA